jgi:flagellar basal-body rod modification protein FlgD
MIDSLASATSASSTVNATTAATSTSSSQSLGKDDFLQLLIAQIKNQDPLQPTENTEFVAQLAQFSSLEQTMGINDRLDALTQQNLGLANSQVVGLVGKQATVKGSLVSTDGSGLATPVSFTLDGASAQTTVTIQDPSGRTVRSLPLGERAPGLVQLTWDGRDDAGNVQPAGSYAVSVQAQNAAGSPVGVSQQTSGTVAAVSFDKGYAVLHLSSGVQVPVSDLVRIDSPQQ